MSTITKLNYLSDTKDEIKDALNSKFNAGITDNDTFRSYVDKIKGIYNNWPKVTGEGTEITLTPTRKGKMQLDLKGNTSQDSTTGKNLFDKANANILNNVYMGSSSLGTSSGAKTLYIECSPNTTYTISRIAGQRFIVADTDVLPATGVSISTRTADNTGTSITITTSATAQYLVVFYYLSNADTLTPEEIVNSMQIEEGSTATDYEPYTNGPSPNPDYPQPIHVVTGNNSVGVQGKNLFDISKIIPSTYIQDSGNTGTSSSSDLSDYIEVKENSDYMLSFDFETLKNLSVRSYCFYDINKNYISGDHYTLQNKSKLFSVPANAKFIRFAYDKNCFDIQVEQSSTATDYEPYYHADYSVNLGLLELCKIGDYQDYLYKENGNWYKYGAIVKKVLNGTENWQKSSSTANTIYYLQNTYYYNTDNRQMFANYFKNVVVWGNNVVGVELYPTNSIRFGLGLSTSITDATKWKEWLTTHNVTTYYTPVTPTSTQITDTTLISQLDSIYNAMSSTDTTTISQTNSDLPFIISASALKKGGN